jgi:cytochrome b
MALPSRSTVMYLPMRVWDAPVRIFHWLIVVLVPACYFTAKAHAFTIHMTLGLTVLALVLFRLIWGLVGSDTARFSRFVKSPAAGLHHLREFARQGPDTEVGHNPAGGWMVLLLLLLLTVQVVSGLGAYSHRADTGGPLSAHLGGAMQGVANLVHSVGVNLIIAAVAVHVAVVVAYAVVRKQNLVRPMLTGKKRLPAATQAPRMASPVLALAVAVIAAGVAWALGTLL